MNVFCLSWTSIITLGTDVGQRSLRGIVPSKCMSETVYEHTSTAPGIDIGSEVLGQTEPLVTQYTISTRMHLIDSSPSPCAEHLGHCLTHESQIPSGRGCLCAKCLRPAGPASCSLSTFSPREPCCEVPSCKLSRPVSGYFAGRNLFRAGVFVYLRPSQRLPSPRNAQICYPVPDVPRLTEVSMGADSDHSSSLRCVLYAC